MSCDSLRAAPVDLLTDFARTPCSPLSRVVPIYSDARLRALVDAGAIMLALASMDDIFEGGKDILKSFELADASMDSIPVKIQESAKKRFVFRKIIEVKNRGFVVTDDAWKVSVVYNATKKAAEDLRPDARR